MLKKVLKISAIILILLLAVAIILPFVFKDKIIAKVKEEANNNLNATLAFNDLDISFFSHFPKLSLELEGLSIVGKDKFNGDTLISAGSFGVSTGFMGLFQDEISIDKVWIEKGNMNFLVLADGTANWDIVKSSGDEKESAAAEEPSTFKAKLQGYKISESSLVYDDKSLGFYTKLSNFTHEGSGDFTADVTNLDTETKIESLDLAYGGTTYLSKTKINYDAQFSLDLKNSKYSFLENELTVNDLVLRFAGFIAMPGDDIDMDITYEAVKNEVKSFISLIPGSFTEDFKDVKSSGKLDFNGFVKGKYNDKSIPGFAFNLNIENGNVQYPALPRALSNMQVKTSITCPGVDADRTIVDISKFHVDLGQFPIDATLNVKTPVSDPDIKATVKGKVDFATLKDVIPLEEGMKIQGVLNADAAFAGRLSAIEKEQYEKFQASGSASLSNFVYGDKDLKDEVRISKADMSFSPEAIDLREFAMFTGKSNLSATGKLSNYLAYALKDEAIEGVLNVNSSYFDLNPFMTETVAPEEAAATETADVDGYIRIPANVGFTLNANFKKLIYDNLDLSDVKGSMKIQDQGIRMSDISMATLGGIITMSGLYDTKDESGPMVSLNLGMQNMNIKQSAKAFNTVEKLAPIAQNTTGSASLSNFNLSFKADKAFNPNMKTVNGSGKLSTSTLEIEGFEMVKKVAETLKIKKLEKWKLEPLNAEFSIVNGEVAVKPFKTKVGNIPAEIAGTNGLDQSIRYAINLDIPRAEFGGAANGVLNSMVSKASSAGVNANLGETIPVTVLVTGTFTDPKVSTDIKSAAGNAMNDLKDQAEQRLKDEAERRKQELENMANDEKDKLKKEAEDKINAEKDRLKSEADKAKAEAERKAKEEADKAKKKAEDEAKKKLKKLF
ncbi:MAG: AsmA-like C-terminal region-containing protein [Bacteroidia bacterium]